MVSSKTLAIGLLGVLYADAAPQLHGLPRAETTDLPDFEVETEYVPVVKTIFRNRPSSIPADLKTTSAVLEGTTRAILVPSNVPTSAVHSVLGHGRKTVVNVEHTMTAWLAEPIKSKKKKPTVVPTATKTGGDPWPTLTSFKTDGSIPVLSGTHSVGMTSLDEQASDIVKSAMSTASIPAAPTDANSPQLTTCGFGGKEYIDGDKITSGNSTYTVHCIQDNAQPAYTMQYVSNGGFNACPAACDRTPGCMGFTFFGDDSGFCYLKSAEGQYSISSNKLITSAFKTTATPGEAGSSSNDSGSGQSNENSKSCKGLGKESFESNNQTYTVACDTDLPGHDIGAVQTSSFSGCFEACNKRAGCSAFSFLGGGGSGTCYLKSKGVPDTSNFNNADSAYLPNPKEDATPSSQGSQSEAAAPTATASGSCESLADDDGPAQFTDKYGSIYNITCKKDIPGGNLKTVVSPTFEECFSQCDENSQCVGFSWLGGFCYLKSSQANSISESPADVAVKVKVGSDVPKATGGQQHSGTITMVQPSATSAAQEPSSPAGLSCKQSPSQIGLYKVTCGSDAQGGDLSMKFVDSFSACFPACDVQSQCIGFAYVGGSGSGVCYFKQKHRPDSSNSSVDIAFKPVAGATMPGLTASTMVPTGISTSGANGIPFTKTESTKTAFSASTAASEQTSSKTVAVSFASSSQAPEKTSSSSERNATSTSNAGSFASTSQTSAKETSSTIKAGSFATSSTHSGSFATSSNAPAKTSSSAKETASSTHAGSFATTSHAPEKTSSSKKKSSSSKPTGSFVSSPHAPEKTTTSEKKSSSSKHADSFVSSPHAPEKTTTSGRKTSKTTHRGSFASSPHAPTKTSHSSKKTGSTTHQGSFATTSETPAKTSHTSEKTSTSEKESISSTQHGSFITTTHAPEKMSSASEKTSSSTTPHGSFITTTQAPDKTSSESGKKGVSSSNSNSATTQHGSFVTTSHAAEKTSSASQMKSSSSSDRGFFISSSPTQASENKSSSSTNGGSFGFVSTSAKTTGASSTSPVWTVTGEATTITKTAAPSISSHSSSQSSSTSKASSPTTVAQEITSSAPTSKHSSSVVVEETTVIKHTKTEEPKGTSTSSSTKSSTSSTHNTSINSTTLQTVTRVTTSAAATTSSKPTSSSTRTLVNTSSSTKLGVPTSTKGAPLPPVTNPGLPIPDGVDPAWAKKCGGLLRDGDWFKLKTRVVRGPQTLDNHYIQAPTVQSFGSGLPTFNSPIPGLLQGAAPRPALCAPDHASGAIFTWAQNDTLAMISDLTTLKDCHQDGLSLLQPLGGAKSGDCSFIPRLASQGATQAEHGGIEYNMGGDGFGFGGWKVCHGSQQLQWMIPGAVFDESRCAEVNLMQERVGAEDPSFKKWVPAGP